ncbi:Uncharacterised protein [Escherichia coli]|uniref:Uncharacterized protein n=1 Tax=Escherichia coli TaxID=562 RepID=A0A376U581_ECOLX|nr:Uncharacterised protein [Escherichia coli]
MSEKPDDLLTPDEVCQKLVLHRKRYVSGILSIVIGLSWHQFVSVQK